MISLKNALTLGCLLFLIIHAKAMDTTDNTSILSLPNSLDCPRNLMLTIDKICQKNNLEDQTTMVQILRLKYNNSLFGFIDNDGSNVLHWASGYGRTKTVEFLLTFAGTNVLEVLCIKHKLGFNALRIAAVQGHTEAIRIMLRFAGCQHIEKFIDPQELQGKNILNLAKAWGKWETVHFLTEIQNALGNEEKLNKLLMKNPM